MLFASFAIGQGTLFLAQTVLVYQDRLALIGLFGTSYLFITLAYSIVDWGGMILLARHELTGAMGDTSSRLYWNLSVVRAAVAIAALVIIAGAAIYHPGTFETNYALAAAPVLVLGIFNPGGLLDGLHRSGINGLATALPIVVSAIALTLVSSLEVPAAGAVLGSALTVGTALATTVQYALLRRLGKVPTFAIPTVRETVDAARSGGLILVTQLPVYIYYRGQVTISNWLLGPSWTGYFIYVKQIVNGMMLSNQIVRRAEFPRLVAEVAGGSGAIRTLLVQKVSLSFGMALASALAIGAGAIWLARSDQLLIAALLLGSYAPVVAGSALYAAFHQAYLAKGRSGTTAVVGTLGVGFGLLLSVATVQTFGLQGFAVAEMVMNVAAFVTLAYCWRGGALRSADKFGGSSI